jgi:hypothetical protein
MPRAFSCCLRSRKHLVAAFVAWFVVGAAPAQARITRIELTRVESPTFGGATFGAVGPYDKLVGRAFGEVNPQAPPNAVIQDIGLAPRNARGNVEYSMDVYILKPHDLSSGNGTILYDVVNRGNKVALNFFNLGTAGGNEPTGAGDGFLQNEGYSVVWSGWQADVLAGNNRLTMTVPIARAKNGAEITGRVRAEYIVTAATSTQNLGSGPFTGLTHASYETVSLDTRKAVLTKRIKESDPRVAVPSGDWAFADCTTMPFPGTPSVTQICLKEGFSSNYIYELLYTAKNPTVLGLGFAATRDLVEFLRHAEKDDAGNANPLATGVHTVLAHGTSQSGRFLRTFVMLGFNQDERNRRVFDGMNPHLASLQLPLNVRFGQPGHAYGQHEDHLYPAAEPPFTYSSSHDAVANKTGGILDLCRKSHSCPKIVHTVSSTEYWQGRMSLDTTDARGQADIAAPFDVRFFHFTGTQHVPAPTAGNCQQPSNPNRYQHNLRALLTALRVWVIDGNEPPPSRIPTLKTGTLVSTHRASVGWPDIPGVKYTGILNGLTLLDFGPGFKTSRETGILTEPPKAKPTATYAVLVPKVDADGNEIAGLQSVALQAPLGTHTGWNLRRTGFAEDEQCGLTGSFIPFAKTKAEREAARDPRLSLEERYGSHVGYVAAVRRAANGLAADRLLLDADVDMLVEQAEASDVLK